MIKSIFRKLFPGPALKQNEIELRNAIIGALTQHLTRIGHPVEAVRIPEAAMPNRAGSTYTNTFFGSSNLRLIAGLDAFGHNVVTGHSASAATTSSTLPLVGHAARPSSALPLTWAEASSAFNKGLDRAARPYPRPATLAEAAEYFARQKGAK